MFKTIENTDLVKKIGEVGVKGSIFDAKIGPTDLSSVLVDRQDILREHKVRIDDLEKQSRAQGDLLDEIQQRSMMGNLIISGVVGKKT